MSPLILIFVGIAAWLAALFGPPVLALWFWVAAAKRFGPWVAHPLFLICAVAVEWTAARAIFFAAQDDGDGPPGLGLALLLPLMTFATTVAIYYGAVIWMLAFSIWRKARVR